MTVQPDMDLSAERTTEFPTWLRVWLVLQATGLIIGLVRSHGSPGLIRFAFWFVLLGVLGWAMFKHAKGPWVIAVFLAIWGVIGGLHIVFVWSSGFDQNFASLLAGFLLAIADLTILVSRQARAWVNEPTERKWAYAKP